MQPSETDVDNSTVVREIPLGESVDLQHLKEVFRQRGIRSDDDALTLIDFRGSRTFDVVALLWVLAMMGTRITSDRLTRFRLPLVRAALDVLRRDRFFEAACQVAQAPLPMLLHLEDVKRVNESAPAPFGTWTSGDPSDQIVQHLRKKRVFGLSLYRLDSADARTAMMREELGRWTDPLALALFSRHLKGTAEWDVARVVVHEILANVQQHPNASTAVVASDMVLPRDDVPQAVLTIAVWDNGDSIVDTLRRGLVGRGDVRVAAAPATDTFRIRREGADPPVADELRTSDWTPDVASDDRDLLMASLLPGISSKSDDGDARSRDRLLGCGLYFLYHHVIDVFQGSLDIYVGAIRLTVEAEYEPDSSAQYVVTLREGLGIPKIRGNLVVARLPTHG
ncbi:hypothetical protein [Verrucosispora sp. WMMD573]|uniref:hypothetical protein n=1 Tax=Verrucosispora sp. WMMD573 TaxID=3015149 RepID=UPI00248BFBA2|nr:hypothetical protein [Verrucosispora sp. WMMD573]WBB53362.1 hypothetical protein O7601_22750 [Verrucosispora sp. WMMD573]